MGANDASFVEWKEEFVSQERGSRIVHYILKDSCGKSILAVIGTERSLRHMVYVVAEEFLSYSGSSTDSPIQAGFKWRSRREVVDWLTSMLAKQQQSESPRADGADALGSPGGHSSLANKMDHRVRNLKQSYSDVVWLGAPWTCGKQLKHYPAFCRNGTTIAVQSFVFVMANEESSYVAYLEDMYEDRKGQKKVKVRWFHHSQEVKGAVRVKKIHPKEVYITPYTQVISVECVDGPAIVLTREHFEKCIGSFPDGLLSKVHLCFRLFKSNKVKPFDLTKLRGYFDQPVISCLESSAFPNSDVAYDGVNGVGVNLFWSGENLGKGTKRKRNSGDQESFLTDHIGAKVNGRKIICASKYGNSDMYDKRLLSKDLECQRLHTRLFKVNDKIELLCQDSGIRGCWFRCTILEMSRKQIKVQYCDVEDQDGCGNLEEWVPAFRLAAADKLGLRCLGRTTIRPCPSTCGPLDTEFVVGAPVDAWWSDGWWEGVVVSATMDDEAADLRVYIPGENLFLNVSKKDVRVSQDWVGGQWVDVTPKPDILSVIDQKTKQPTEPSALVKDDKQPESLPPEKDDKLPESLDDTQPEKDDKLPESLDDKQTEKDDKLPESLPLEKDDKLLESLDDKQPESLAPEVNDKQSESMDDKQPDFLAPEMNDKQPDSLDDKQPESLAQEMDNKQQEALTPMKDETTDKIDNSTLDEVEAKSCENEKKESDICSPAPSNSHHEQVNSPEKDSNPKDDDVDENVVGMEEDKGHNKDETAEMEIVDGCDEAIITVQN